MDFNRPVAAPRQRRIAAAMRLDLTGLDDEQAGAAAACKLREIVAELGVETSLRRWGVSDEDLVAVAEGSVEDFMCLTNPRPVESPEAVLEILRRAY
jgi:alcohol dehydrogenase class IV